MSLHRKCFGADFAPQLERKGREEAFGNFNAFFWTLVIAAMIAFVIWEHSQVAGFNKPHAIGYAVSGLIALSAFAWIRQNIAAAWRALFS